MRIIGGAWRGRPLVAPAGRATRPTADRVRQALFDRLLHAPWAGRAAIDGARVLDAFAGTGALGLEALSRGAAEAVFIERDRAALRALRRQHRRLRGGGAMPRAGRRTRCARRRVRRAAWCSSIRPMAGSCSRARRRLSPLRAGCGPAP